MENLREQVKHLIEDRGLSQSDVARAVGVSPTQISLYLKGSYAGNIDALEKKLKSYLHNLRMKDAEPEMEHKFVLTDTARTVINSAELCKIRGGLYVIYGDAGIGKSAAIRHFVESNPDVIHDEANLSYTTKVFFSKLHKRAGLDGIGALNKLFDDLVTKLRGSGRMVIIDEAEHLPYRALDLLRSLYDATDIGLLLVGMPRLIANLRGNKSQFKQLYSRVDLAIKAEPEKDAEQLETVQKLVNAYMPDSNGAWKEFAKHTRNVRTLTKLIEQCKRIGQLNDVSIDSDLIAETAKYLIR